MENKTKQAVLSLSGGMDSSTLLLHLLSKGYEVTALSFDYGQKHKIELERASELVNYINHTIDNLDFDKKIQWVMRNRDIELENLYVTEAANNMTQIKHQIIKLDGLSQLLNSSLVEGGTEVPEGHYVEENMKDTVVPNRNKIFSSIIQAAALSAAEVNDTECAIAMGIHAGDHSIYPDCRQEFRDADFEAFKLGNWGSEKVTLYTPYLKGDKFDILQDGEKCCKQLDLDFNEIYKRTNTSYKPMKHNGVWYSDYKSASSVERIEAFIKLGLPDPVEYADETGPVTWEVAKKHVEQILDSHK
jgi:7-cyano-7-deazaguanine synthase